MFTLHFNKHFFFMHISCFMFLPMDYFLLSIFYVFQTIEMMLEKRQIQAIFLLEFKMGHNAAETTCNLSNAFGSGTASEHTVWWWFKKFCKGDQSLEDEEHSDWPLEVDNNQLRGSSKLILLQLLEKLPKNSVLIILCSFGI